METLHEKSEILPVAMFKKCVQIELQKNCKELIVWSDLGVNVLYGGQSVGTIHVDICVMSETECLLVNFQKKSTVPKQEDMKTLFVATRSLKSLSRQIQCILLSYNEAKVHVQVITTDDQFIQNDPYQITE